MAQNVKITQRALMEIYPNYPNGPKDSNVPTVVNGIVFQNDPESVNDLKGPDGEGGHKNPDVPDSLNCLDVPNNFERLIGK